MRNFDLCIRRSTNICALIYNLYDMEEIYVCLFPLPWNIKLPPYARNNNAVLRKATGPINAGTRQIRTEDLDIISSSVSTPN